jgi:hypothetical protein
MKKNKLKEPITAQIDRLYDEFEKLTGKNIKKRIPVFEILTIINIGITVIYIIYNEIIK